ncbi:MAG: hypothetical protein FXF54_08230 [Kosmotoga sp.]|nr:MAG: hypothetical protein FXF54_08230 [Kosmotoga sp.]
MNQNVLRLDKPILRFKVFEDLVYIISDKLLIKADKESFEVTDEKVIFPKNSQSRDFVIDENDIYCKDFCTLYKIDAKTLEIEKRWKLGTDLSSDICSLGFDSRNIYVTIRNGDLAVINKKSEEPLYYRVSDSSIWNMIVDDHIYAGNVNGDLLVIDKTNFKVNSLKNVHKKNLKSLFIDDNLIYTASQDLSIAKINKNSHDIIITKKKCHRKMFYFAGMINNYLTTVSPPCRETKFWKKTDLSLSGAFNRGTRNSLIYEDFLYETEGNILKRIPISTLVSL